MKVLIAITQSNEGGAQRYVADLSGALPKDRFDVVVAAGGDGALFRALSAQGIRAVHLDGLVRSVSWRDVSSFFEFLRILKHERPDIVHSNSSKMGFIAALACLLSGVPHLFTAHGWEFNAPRPLLQRLCIRMLSILTVMLSDHTIAVSDSVRNAMPEFLRSRITTIRNGIPVFDFLEKQAARSALSIDQDAFVIGTVAELHPVKNLTIGLNAFAKVHAQHPHVRWVIIGDGRERARLEKHIRDKNLGDSVSLLGHVEHASKYMRAFDVAFLPSLSEAFSYALLEAGLACVPPVASRTGGIPELIQTESYGLLAPPKDAGAFSSALLRLIDEPALRTAMGESIQRHVRDGFSLDRMAEETMRIYGVISRGSDTSRA